ncbi:hypothetical protein [Vibrio parahaemolyticus]|uniref:hypothetical protein n=1 Tax=Vibrio parahaemolyticus TaxID=670 RepID=UPI001481EF52|nr:hypothetical protein [Vibrio parahaemolyticus]MDF4337004.1 hypothetical protein [Vibrio parahaemolyticus]
MTDFIGQKVARLESSVEHQETLITDLKERIKSIESRRFDWGEVVVGIWIGLVIAYLFF